MGVSGFAKFIEDTFPGTVTVQHIRNLSMKGRVAVDGYNESYTQMYVSKKSFIKKMTPEEVFGYFGNMVSREELRKKVRKVWLHRILDFVITDLKKNVVWVFDGAHVPMLKDEVRSERRERHEKIKSDMESMTNKYETDVFPDLWAYRKMLEDYITSKPPSSDDYQALHAILVNIGIPVIKAYGEGEKTCARLCNPVITLDPEILCGCVWSADVDSLLFGAPVLMQRHRTFTRGVEKDIGDSSSVRVFDMSQIPITLESLVKTSVAAGCDYLPKGIPGLGLKKAYKLFGPTPEKFPEEHLPIVEMFSHTPEEVDCRILEVSTQDPIVKWFVTMYGR